MPVTPRSTAGTQVYVSAAAPATTDAAGYGALTWTEIEGFDNIGAIGTVDEVGNFDSIKDGRIKYRSISDPGQFEGSPLDLPADAGQIILAAAKAAANGSAAETISLQIEDEAGYGTYARIMVSTWQRNYGGATDVITRVFVAPIVAGSIVEYEP